MLKNKLLTPSLIELSIASNYSSTSSLEIFNRLNKPKVDLPFLVTEFQKLRDDLISRQSCSNQAYPKAYNIADELCLLIYLTVRTYHPLTILETGVANGVSSYFILNAMNKNNQGTLYSTDIASDVGGILNEEEKKRWKLKVLNNRKIGSQFREIVDDLPSMDIFVHDSDHTFDGQMSEYKQIYHKISDSGFLISDDVDMSYAFIHFCSTHGINPMILVTSTKVVGLFQKTTKF